MRKNVVKLNEAQLRKIVAESVEKVLKEKYMDDYNCNDIDCQLDFIDRNEIEEMLGEYYDFSNVGIYAWKQIDSLIHSECERRGVSPEDYDAYARVCDVCVGKVLGQ